MESIPQDSPTTTPASTTLRQGYGIRFTPAIKAATPNVTDQLTITRFFVAWNIPMEYSGANKR